jgi:hypothetical protein
MRMAHKIARKTENAKASRTDVIHRGRDVTYLEPADPADPRY